MKTTKKGLTQLAGLQYAAIAIVVLVIVVSIGAQILGQIQSTQSNTSTEYNVTGKGISAMSTFGDWFAIIVIVVIAVVIISLLLGAFAFRGAA